MTMSWLAVICTTAFVLNSASSSELVAKFEVVTQPPVALNKSSKILSGPSRPYPRPTHTAGDQYGVGSGNNPSVQAHPAISSIEMQLVGAMEKLVGKMDGLEGRVKTLESIVHYLTSKDKEKPGQTEVQHQPQQPDQPQRGGCPQDFVKIDGIKGKCYHVSSYSKPQNIFDWKTGAQECGRLGGRLAEMLSYSDFHRISHFLSKYTNTRNPVSTDYWTGGLNPGLIWIWSESGQQIDLDKRYWNDNDNSSNAPGCLKLSYSIRLNTFFFKGAPCSQTQNFLCEVLDNSVARALRKFEMELIESDEDSTAEVTNDENTE